MRQVIAFIEARLHETEKTAVLLDAATWGVGRTTQVDRGPLGIADIFASAVSDGTVYPYTYEVEGSHVYSDQPKGQVCSIMTGRSSTMLPTAQHIVRHDPAQVLRQVRGLRLILERLTDEPPDSHLRAVMRCMLYDMASMWSTHPDYREDW